MIPLENARLLLLLSLCIGLAAVGCKGCDKGDDGNGVSPGGGETDEWSRAKVIGPGMRLRTNDGYDVILAGTMDPRDRSTKLSRQEQQEREQMILEPNRPDPDGGEFTLQQAVEGMPTDGKLVAEFVTEFGAVMCDLYADRAPNTVANFIGLARGKRHWWNPKAGEWTKEPAYNDTRIHRVVPGFGIQFGDHLRDGTGRVGYDLAKEPVEGLMHDRRAQLMMAGAGSAQIFISDGAAAHLDTAEDNYSIFGQCQQEDVISQLARVPQRGAEGNNQPVTELIIRRVFIRRVRGGAANARRSQPAVAEEFQGRPRGASPGPSEIQHRLNMGARGLEPDPVGGDGHGH